MGVDVRNKSFLVFFLIFTSCATQHFVTTPNLTLSPLSNDIRQRDNYQAKVNFIGFKNWKYEFSVFIRNSSKDSISVNPSLFSYNSMPEKSKISPHLIYSINPEERMNQLEMQKDSLMKEKNPYSLAGKSTKELVRRGLINGTIASIFGQDHKKWESQRDKDEYYWEQDHNYYLNRVKKELEFWNNDALLSQVVAPNNKINGKVLFPISKSAKEIQVRILVQNDTLNFRFAQSGKQ